MLVERALERHDEVGHLLQRGPAPGRELRVAAGDVDIAVLAGEAEGEPSLALAAEAAAPETGDQLVRQVVAEPVAALGQELGRGRADLLLQLAPGGLDRALARVDAALR